MLPHTIRANDHLLASLDHTCTIFCRDPESYIHLTKVNTQAEVYLEHDMACHLNPKAFVEDPQNVQLYEPIVLETLASRGLGIVNKPLLNLFRTDVESAQQSMSFDMDISQEYHFGVWPEDATKAAWCMLKTVQMATFIQTDRLHVAIACALMGTPCLLYDNSYGKNGGVFRHSLRTRAPFIKFREFTAPARVLHHEAF